MTIKRFIYGLVLAVLSALLSCANVVMPSGGKKDSTAPEIKEIDPPRLSTNIQPDKITFTFDEFFSVTKPLKNILISPPLEPFPVLSIKGKKMILKLGSGLIEDKTYIFTLNNLVKDINEGVKLENFQYVFSTGNKIDSCIIAGKVVSGPTLEPLKNIWVGLYSLEKKDSFTSQKPLYLTKTDASGSFIMKYIKKGTYCLYALDDKNQNIYYDLPNENIGLYNDVINFDSSDQVNLSPIILFNDYGSKNLKTHSSSSTHILISGWFEFDSNKYIFNDNLISRTLNDSVIFFNTNLNDSIYDVKFSNGLIDTSFQIAFNNDKEHHIVRVLSDEFNLLNDSTILFQFSGPVKKFNGNVFIKYDSLTICVDSLINISSHFIGKLNYMLRPGISYSIVFGDSAFTDIFDNYSTSSTLSIGFSNNSDLGKLILNYDKTLVEGTELILLYTKNKLVNSARLSKIKESISFNKLLPDSYDLFLIEDIDNNGSWSPGIYSQRRQPENTFTLLKGINIRANWELEDSISLKRAYK
ncbi:MAG TPA: hypothetical protein EYQ86_03700 [Bacteroidetes bacterium]|nr:hypothetical protein [Bacteroidota bacterium]